jgi:hypothetical protein
VCNNAHELADPEYVFTEDDVRTGYAHTRTYCVPRPTMLLLNVGSGPHAHASRHRVKSSAQALREEGASAAGSATASASWRASGPPAPTTTTTMKPSVRAVPWFPPSSATATPTERRLSAMERRATAGPDALPPAAILRQPRGPAGAAVSEGDEPAISPSASTPSTVARPRTTTSGSSGVSTAPWAARTEAAAPRLSTAGWPALSSAPVTPTLPTPTAVPAPHAPTRGPPPPGFAAQVPAPVPAEPVPVSVPVPMPVPAPEPVPAPAPVPTLTEAARGPYELTDLVEAMTQSIQDRAMLAAPAANASPIVPTPALVPVAAPVLVSAPLSAAAPATMPTTEVAHPVAPSSAARGGSAVLTSLWGIGIEVDLAALPVTQQASSPPRRTPASTTFDQRALSMGASHAPLCRMRAKDETDARL